MFSLLKSDLYRLVRGKMLWVCLVALLCTIGSGTGLLAFATSPEFAQMVNEAAEANAAEKAAASSREAVDPDKADAWEQLAEIEGDGSEGRAATSAAASSGAAADAAASSGAAASSSAASSAAASSSAAATENGSSLSAGGELGLTPEEAETLNEKTFSSYTYSVGQMVISGGFASLLSGLVVALFFTSDFSTGFAKSLLSSRRGRRSYYAEKLVLAALVTGVFVAASMVITGAFFALAGFTYDAAETPGDVALWAVLVWLVITAYSFIVAVAGWLTRSKAAAVVVAALVSTTILESILLQVLMLLSPAVPALAQLANFSLANCVGLLSGGSAGLTAPSASLPVPALTPAGWTLVVSALYLTALGALALGACRRKDV